VLAEESSPPRSPASGKMKECEERTVTKSKGAFRTLFSSDDKIVNEKA
jgi:hypothetical protein